jgi:DNA-binding transcriptional LysR family regulator
MELERIKTFYVVAKAGSFSKAADEVGLTQSALSRQIMQLEELLETRLFNRHARRGLILTAEGEYFLQKASKVLSDVESLKTCLHTLVEPQGKFTIATTHGIAGRWLSDWMKTFLNKYPKVELKVICSDLHLDLTLREADIAIRPYDPDLQHHVQKHLMTLNFKAYASPEYLKRFGTPQTPAELDRHRLLIYGHEKEFSLSKVEWLLYEGAKEGKTRRPYIIMNSVQGLQKLVAAGLGICAFSVVKGQNNDCFQDLVNVFPQVKGPSSDLYCIYPEQSQDSVNIQAFVAHLTEESQKLLSKS